MLTSLSIRDFLLIENLHLEPDRGLTVLTGETGAGKSILLDALGAACGARSEAGLVRKGAEKTTITASFDLPEEHPALTLLSANDLPPEREVLLRRVIEASGKSRAFVNDQPVSVGFLKSLGQTLLEVHGQFDTHGLLDPATHLGLLDRFAALKLEPLAEAYRAWREAEKAEAAAKAQQAEAAAREAELTDAVNELTRLAPKPGEDEELTTRRNLLQNSAKISEGLATAREALSGETGAEPALTAAARALAKIAEKAGEKATQALAQLDSARDAVAEASSLLEALADETGEGGPTLEQVEDRLYALRAAARRHRVDLPDLPQLAEALQAQLNLLTHGDAALLKLSEATRTRRAAYEALAQETSTKRQKAARKLETALNAELAPLKLDKAEFKVEFTPRPDTQWNADGLDTVRFLVRTNPGAPHGPLDKIASGGELARFMLALRLVLADSASALTLIFDEVDQGVGGAVAAAVGERLAKLGLIAQVLVVTHSPQVAAKGQQHWRIEKEAGKSSARTHVRVLADDARREEVARMLAGETITDAARKAAQELLAS